jgi:seryl-tRNA synthetase
LILKSGQIAGADFPCSRASAQFGTGINQFYAYVAQLEKQGYTEISPPFNGESSTMTAKGQLPKFEEDAFNIKNNDYF